MISKKGAIAIIKFMSAVGICSLIVYGCVWLYFFSPAHFDTVIAQLAKLQGYPLAYQALFNQIYLITLLIGMHCALVVYVIRFLYIRRK